MHVELKFEILGRSHSKITNCENDHDENDNSQTSQFVLADFEDEFKKSTEQFPLVFWREK